MFYIQYDGTLELSFCFSTKRKKKLLYIHLDIVKFKYIKFTCTSIYLTYKLEKPTCITCYNTESELSTVILVLTT